MEDIQPQEGAREFGLSSWSVTNRTTVFVLMAIIIISGLYSYITVPKESFPEVVIPEIYIGTPTQATARPTSRSSSHAPREGDQHDHGRGRNFFDVHPRLQRH